MNYVLMSTYNGEKYVSEQLNSIANQNWDGQCIIIVRDDGSSDNTIKILLEKKIEFEVYGVELIVIEGENVGVIRSFNLLCQSLNTDDDDLIFFSDQDDVWMLNRYQMVSKKFIDLKIDLYCSALTLVNNNLEPIGSFNHKEFLGRDNLFPILSNFITGCSLCIRGNAFKKLNFEVPPAKIPMHDWWIAMQAYFYSFDIYYDEESSVLYRQHDNNVVGITSIYKKLFLPSFWRQRIESNIKSSQIFLLDESKIAEHSLLALKKIVESRYHNIFGRITICLKYFKEASFFRWFLFIFLK